MKEHEIEKLREKLGDEYSVKRQNGAITVELVDIWKGVEFAEVICESNGLVTNGKIYRIFELSIENLFIVNDKGQEFGVLNKSSAKPSTESAYVEQLKSKANELYGDIEDVDRFDVIIFGGHEYVSVGNSNIGFTYLKLDDKLYFGDIPIYEKGKWAKKVDRVNVEGKFSEYSSDHLTVRFKFNYKGSHPNPVELSSHLSKCLEDYLNKIP